MSEQLKLFPDELIPYSRMYVDAEYISAIDVLFRLEVDGRLPGPKTPCPYEANFLEVRRMCDCETAHNLVQLIGRYVPHCQENRCPVRVVIATKPR